MTVSNTWLRSHSGIGIELTESGAVAAIDANSDLTINQYRLGPHDVAISGLFLRRRSTDGSISAVSLVGRADIERWVATDHARWVGRDLGVSWTVDLVLDSDLSAWVWRVALCQADAERLVDQADQPLWDLAVLQDISLAPRAIAQSSESYVSQYVAHRLVADPEFGFMTLSRQTMASAPVLPLFGLAIAEGAVAAGTDGFDHYGVPSRAGHTPAFLTGEEWTNRVRQHEMAMPGLLTSATDLGEAQVFHIVARYWSDYRGDLAAQIPSFKAEITGFSAYADLVANTSNAELSAVNSATSILATAGLISGDTLADEELFEIGGEGEPRFVERDAHGAVLSFFTPTGAHVVRGEKDLGLIRPHGHVLIADDALTVDRPTLSTTVFAHGVFSSHIAFGNTNFDRFLSVHRNHLNLLRSNGMRVLIKKAGTWRMLGQPSAFILDQGEARWIYKLGAETIVVRTTSSANQPVILTEISRDNPNPAPDSELDLIVTLDVDFADGSWSAIRSESALLFQADAGTAPAEHHADLRYALAVSPGATIEGDAPLFCDHTEHGSQMVTVGTETPLLRLAISADLEGGNSALGRATHAVTRGIDADANAISHRQTLAQLTRSLTVAADSRFAELELLAPWWAHDARVHFLVPHGLEQYSGAAWGTRDVCQGPLELFLASGHFAAARDILVRVFSKQSITGTFPQWFMFDDYDEVFHDHFHGDIVVWPLFALGQYLRATGDHEVLSEIVDFRDGAPATVAAHLSTLLDYVENHLVPGTSLPAYGEGDWDDTLQPARAEMRDRMASSWTSALACQALTLAAEQLRGANDSRLRHRMSELAERIRADISEYLLPDGIVPGFVNFDFDAGVADSVSVTPVIHPSDDQTGLSYRLIPMTRMLIAELFDDAQVARHEQIIRTHLHFPDGVRLLDKPARWADGEIKWFRRAEQAAFFGREVGLMYAHAHVRWVEALAALGRSSVGEELLRLSPIGMRERVPSALARQRTCYTSSSDATFPDRYTAARDFDRLRTGQVPTADGWRVYSSGPGIYLRQIFHGLLGLQELSDRLIVAPNLDIVDDGLEIELVIAGRKRTVHYSSQYGYQCRGSLVLERSS